jgi:hypothetical protein
MFVLSRNCKGALAESEITSAAIRLGIPVLKPVAEHGRYDLAFDVANQIMRVQCKWASFDRAAGVIKVGLASSWCTPNGYEHRHYAEGEIDLVAVYCGDLDRCYLLPHDLAIGRRGIWLRLTPPKNAQRACVNLASSFEFQGAVAQLEERLAGSQQVRGSSPLSSTSFPDAPDVIRTGSNEFREPLWALHGARGCR